jgi:Zn ribbon nucleic-acid-binding protein
MSNKQFVAGDHIAAKCTKCKDTTNHTVVALVEGKVARVECNTCGGIHNYRPAAAKKTPARSRAAATKAAKINKIEVEWQEHIDAVDPATAVDYSMTMSAKPGLLLQHPSFGLGRIITTTKPNKMEVFFRDGVKILRCSVS